MNYQYTKRSSIISKNTHVSLEIKDFVLKDQMNIDNYYGIICNIPKPIDS
jgi:hypothetical protein